MNTFRSPSNDSVVERSLFKTPCNKLFKVLCDVTRLIAQTVFSLIDYINIWINKKRKITPKGGKLPLKLQSFVDNSMLKFVENSGD